MISLNAAKHHWRTLNNGNRSHTNRNLQVRLIHIHGLLDFSTKGGDQHLVDFIFHDEVRQPPTLGSLNAISVDDVDDEGIGDVRPTYLFPFFASLCWVTDEGETDAASLACCESRAFWTAGGNTVPYGTLNPSAQSTRIAKSPEREPVFLPYPSSG